MFQQYKDMAPGIRGTIMALGLIVRVSLTLKIEVVKITFKGPVFSPEKQTFSQRTQGMAVLLCPSRRPGLKSRIIL